ncbi:MAG TPA: hypothetical protein VGN02_11420 [Paenibacillus sp.]|jgi:hypothetical protein
MTRTEIKSTKPWWESKSKFLLQEYAKKYEATFVEASFKNWKYTGRHVLIRLPHERGQMYLTVTDSSNSNGTNTNNGQVIGIKYKYKPRRKFEYLLSSVKSPLLLMFHRNLRQVTLPNPLSKSFHAGASHPSLLRGILKHEGITDLLEWHKGARLKARVKEHEAELAFTETNKKADVEFLRGCVQIMELFIEAMREQGIVREVK